MKFQVIKDKVISLLLWNKLTYSFSAIILAATKRTKISLKTKIKKNKTKASGFYFVFFFFLPLAFSCFSKILAQSPIIMKWTLFLLHHIKKHGAIYSFNFITTSVIFRKLKSEMVQVTGKTVLLRSIYKFVNEEKK